MHESVDMIMTLLCILVICSIVVFGRSTPGIVVVQGLEQSKSLLLGPGEKIGQGVRPLLLVRLVLRAPASHPHPLSHRNPDRKEERLRAPKGKLQPALVLALALARLFAQRATGSVRLI